MSPRELFTILIVVALAVIAAPTIAGQMRLWIFRWRQRRQP